MPDITPPVSTLIEAVNRHDTAGFLTCFTDNGVVDDWGREFRGAEAIRGWSDRELIGVNVRLDVVDVTHSDHSVTVTADVGGDGFNGPSHFTFTNDGDQITRMEIRA